MVAVRCQHYLLVFGVFGAKLGVARYHTGIFFVCKISFLGSQQHDPSLYLQSNAEKALPLCGQQLKPCICTVLHFLHATTTVHLKALHYILPVFWTQPAYVRTATLRVWLLLYLTYKAGQSQGDSSLRFWKLHERYCQGIYLTPHFTLYKRTIDEKYSGTMGSYIPHPSIHNYGPRFS